MDETEEVGRRCCGRVGGREVYRCGCGGHLCGALSIMTARIDDEKNTMPNFLGRYFADFEAPDLGDASDHHVSAAACCGGSARRASASTNHLTMRSSALKRENHEEVEEKQSASGIAQAVDLFIWVLRREQVNSPRTRGRRNAQLGNNLCERISRSHAQLEIFPQVPLTTYLHC